MRSRLSIILMIFLAMATPGWGRDIYVNNVAGDDGNDGSAPDAVGDGVGPYRTISRALRITHKGDRLILVNTGTVYRESITLQGARQSGLRQTPFELVGNGVVLDGTVRVPSDAWSHYEGQVFRYRPPKTSFQMLYLGDRPAQRCKVSEREEIRTSSHSSGVCSIVTSIFVSNKTDCRRPTTWLSPIYRWVSRCTKCAT